jgi:nucleoside-diphosphate-sugar epimerase
MKNSRVVVFGAGGYVGSRLVPELLNSGFHVRAFDTYWYGNVFQEVAAVHGKLEIVEGDIRDIEKVDNSLRDADAVIHLACISNDPSFDLNPQLGKSVNLDSFEPLVKSAKNAGVSRFIFASSSSVYGIKKEERVTESLPLEPLTDYSKFKAQCEEILLSHISSNFVCTVVRPATVCGFSPRQRFDLAVNILTNHAMNKGEITVLGGSQFRPNLHIEDMVDAYLHILKSDTSKIIGEIFNIGGKNLTLSEIAMTVSKITGVSNIKYQPTNDLRSYRVDSGYIERKIGFIPKRNVDDAVRELVYAFDKRKFVNPLENTLYFNIKRMKELNLA